MIHRGRRCIGLLGLLGALLLICGQSANALQISSPSYGINGNIGGSFGGQSSSTNYSLRALGGETIVGSGSSTSYIIDQAESSTTPALQMGVQPSGLVAYYPLDENTGTTTNDASSYQNNGTLTGSPTWNATGKIGSGVSINGPTDSTGTGSVIVPNNSNLPSGSAMSVEAWVNQTAWYQNQAIASVWQSGTTASWAVQTGTNNNLRIYIATSQTDTGTTYVETATNSWNTFGSWRHVTVTYDGTQAQANRVKVYINGALMPTTVTGTLPATLLTSTASLSLGSVPGQGRALTGSLDQIKLFNRPLASSEVSAEYSAQNSGIPTGFGFPVITTGSVAAQQDAIIRTSASNYTVSIQQDHDLQGTSGTISAISSGTIASPAIWAEGTTKGLGFTLTGAPVYDTKWTSGTKYAAFPSSGTSIYTATGHVSSVIDTLNLAFRLDTLSSQPSGSYTNNITYTGTSFP